MQTYKKISAAFVKRYFLSSPCRENLFLFGVLNFLGLSTVVVVMGLQFFSDDLILLLFTSFFPSALQSLFEELIQQGQYSVIPDFFVLLLPFYIVSFFMTVVAYKNVEKHILAGKNLIAALFIFIKFYLFLLVAVFIYGLFLDGRYYHYQDGITFVAFQEDVLLFMFIVYGALSFIFGLRLIVQTRTGVLLD